MRDPVFEAWVEDARKADIVAWAEKRGAQLRRTGGELVGPCPACGGTDRFAINVKKQIFNCRGAVGGDVIAMIQHLDACDFVRACAEINGCPAPRGETGEIDEAERARRAQLRQENAARREREEVDYRERERRAAWEIWCGANRSAPTPLLLEPYLGGRSIQMPAQAPLRMHGDLPYWEDIETGRVLPDGKKEVRKTIIHRGPAMLAAIVDDAGRFAGVHITWFDPSRPGRKAAIVHPGTGEIMPAKKIRGSKRRAAIRLCRQAEADAFRLVAGEGIETVLSVYMAERDRPVGRRTAYWSLIDLGHLGGKAVATVPHPSLTRSDARGRVIPVRVPGPAPLAEPGRDLELPGWVEELILLGDGDSDRFTTEMALKRAAARWARSGRTIRIAWAPEGRDFNDMLRGAA
jgi:hypothetical protein